MERIRPDLAVLVYDFSATGVTRNAIRIAAKAAAEGLRTELWVMRDQGPFARLVPANVAVVGIHKETRSARDFEPKMGLRRGLANLAAVPKLARIIRTLGPLVLMSGGNHFHLAAGLAYRLAGSPQHTRFIGRASNATPRLGQKPTPFGRLANRIDATKYRHMHKIIAVSRELGDDLAHKLHISRERIVVIPNGIDLDEIERLAGEPLDDPWFSPGAPPVIVSAGRLTRQKNYPHLVDAFARLRRAHAARLVIFGEGGPEIRAALKSQGEQLGVAADMRLAGYDPNPMRYFARARLFVLTSLWEGASNVLLEALACGCPVVATDCPTGIKEILDGGRIGEIVPQQDAEALAEAMGRSLGARVNREKLRCYASRFRIEPILASYVDLIRSEMARTVPG